MTITAKYQGKCIRCGGAIHPGNKIDWDKRTRKTAHLDCDEIQTATAVTSTNGGASDRQIAYLKTLLVRLARVRQFDSQGGSGESWAAEMRDELRSGVTRQQASQMIEDALGLLDDEM